MTSKRFARKRHRNCMMNSTTKIETFDRDLSLAEIVDFLRDYWRGILSATLLGLGLAVAYVYFAPRFYEATFQVEMARTKGIQSVRLGENGGAGLRGTPVEDGQLLVERLRMPSTYPSSMPKVCGTEQFELPHLALAERIDAKVVNGVTSVVEIAVRARDSEIAKRCAQAVFNMIQSQQNELFKPLLESVREDIQLMQVRFKNNQELLSEMDKSSVQSAVYLAKRDESLWLMDQIAALERSLRHVAEARLVSPIYVSSEPASPRTSMVLLVGLLAGAMVGTIIAFFARSFRPA